MSDLKQDLRQLLIDTNREGVGSADKADAILALFKERDYRIIDVGQWSGRVIDYRGFDDLPLYPGAPAGGEDD